jgi:hypothetical protein
MVKRYNNFFGSETGGGEEASSTVGSPDFTEATVVRSGLRSLKLPGATTAAQAQFAVQASNPPVDGGGNYAVGFAVRFTDTTPTSTQRFWVFRRNNDASSIARLELTTSGNVEVQDDGGAVVDTITAPFTVNTWHFIEMYIVTGASGTIDVWIDGTQKTTAASGSFDENTPHHHRFTGSATAGEDTYIDDWYIRSGCTASTDRLGDAEVIGPYQGVGSPTTNLTPDSGAWTDLGDLPLNETTEAAWTTNTGAGGYVQTDGSSRAGPSGDGRIDGDDNIKSSKHVYRLKQGTGQTRAMRKSFGNSTDGINTQNASLTTAYADYYVISEAGMATGQPLSTEYIRHGFEKSAGGGKDLLCAEIWSMLLHVPAAGGVSVTPPQGDLALSTAAPTVVRTDNHAVDVPAADLSLSTTAPGLSVGLNLNVPAADLALSSPAPSINLTANISIDVLAADLSLSSAAPTADVTTGISIPVPAADLALSAFVPSVAVTADVTITVPGTNLVFTTTAPAVSAGGSVNITVPVVDLTLSTVGPAVQQTEHIAIDVPGAALVLSTVAPQVARTANITVQVPAADLALSAIAPSLTRTEHWSITVPVAAMALSSAAPGVAVGVETVPPFTAALTSTGPGAILTDTGPGATGNT